MTNPHPHAELLKRLADDQSLRLWIWGPQLQAWFPADPADLFYRPKRSYALGEKPTQPPRKMCELAGVKFPMPETVAPEVGTHYWTPDVDKASTQAYAVWAGSIFDFEILAAGRLHLAPETALAHYQALIAVNKQAMEAAK